MSGIHDHPAPTLVGRLLEGRYRVDSPLARGGMSTVYRGLDTRLQRPVAIKIMDATYAADPTFLERFEREAVSSARLHRSDVVAVYDQGADQQPDGALVYLVMQLVEGGTLRQLLASRGRLPLPVALSVLESVASALAAAHHVGMVHRDIKPENVLIGAAQDGTGEAHGSGPAGGSVKVADFGLARATASTQATSGNIVLGTVAYMAPEQVTSGEASAASDVYAAGILAYEMLTGAPPFSGDSAAESVPLPSSEGTPQAAPHSPMAVAYQHVHERVPAPSQQVSGLPVEVDQLVAAMTQREPTERLADGTVLLKHIRAVRTRLGIPLVPVPVPGAEAAAQTERISNDPPTHELPRVDDAPATAVASSAPHGGPQGTRTYQRDQLVPAPPEPPRLDRPGPPRRKKPWWIAGIVGLLGLLALFGWWSFAGSVQVPAVVGQPQGAAEKLLNDAQLTPVVSHDHHNTVPEGTVISSSPSAGSTAFENDEVELVVSLGQPSVPRIVPGTSVDEAQSLLRTAKFQPELNGSQDRYDRTVPEGAVLGVTPEPGTRLPISSPVTVVVSKGPPPVRVPDVRGLNQQAAFAALSRVGFEPFVAGQEFANDVEAGHVVSTSPSAGTEVRLSGHPRIGVVVSNAITVPQFSGTSVSTAQQQAAQLGLQLNVRSLLNRPDGLIIGQYPLPGSKVAPGTVIHASAF